MENQFCIQYCRFHVSDAHKFLICGYWKERRQQEPRLLVSMDYNSITYTAEKLKRIKNIRMYTECEQKEYIWVNLPVDYENYRELRVFERRGTQLLELYQIDTVKLKKLWYPIPVHLDEVKKHQGWVKISGWYIAETPAVFTIQREKRADIISEVKVCRRPDVERAYPEAERNDIRGFHLDIQMSGISGNNLYIRSGATLCQLELKAGGQGLRGKGARLRSALRKVQVYYQQFGLKRTLYRSYEKLSGKENTSYEIFRLKYMPGRRELLMQRQKTFEWRPEFAVVVPLYKTPENYLDEMIESVCSQTYSNWTLYLSDGSGKQSPLTGKLNAYSQKEKRIKIIHNDTSLRIVENTNRALAKVKEDYIVFLDHDDMLTPDALYECAKVLNQNKETDIIYTDEDKISSNGKEFYQPHFKPDFNLDLLRSANYMCHLFVVSRQLFEQVGFLRSEYEGSQDYDFILRCIEKTNQIMHIPKILYHWRIHPGSVAGNPSSKEYAYEAGKKAIRSHYQRVGIQAEVGFMSPGYYRSLYHMEREPLVSVIIPNKDHKKDLKRCIKSIQKQESYSNMEILIVENNSESKEIFQYYGELQKQYGNVRILYYDKEFNYSAIQNFAAARAKGEYILLLNNDTYLSQEDGIKELVSYCMRDDVGIVGAKLLYPDDTIQHAGVVVGLGGVAGHAFLGQPGSDPGYFCRITCAQDYSAVTAACMMVKKQVFQDAGGMDTGLQVAFNDTDFCLRVMELGYRIVYNPFSVWYHDESKTRGAEDTPEKVERFQKEIKYFKNRWRQFLDQGDPNYNPNLTLDRHDFSLRI